MTDLNVEGMALAPGVVETIASIAANEVEGVAAVGSSSSSLFKLGGKPAGQGIEATLDDDGALRIAVRVDVYYGSVLPEVAANLRTAISDAMAVQVGIPVGSVDVYIDGIVFSR